MACTRFFMAMLAVATLLTAPLSAQQSPYAINAVLSLTGGAASIGADEAALRSSTTGLCSTHPRR
jgi:hypothetical protein